MRRTGFLVAFLVVMITAGWWMFLISPRNSEIADLNDQRDLAMEAELRLRTQIQQLEEIRDSEVQYLAALGQLETLIPERPLLDEFIEQIHALANDTGVSLETLSPAIPSLSSTDSELREITVGVQIEGKFFELLGFLFGLSDLDRLVRVDSIGISSTQDETEGTILGVSIQLRVFTLADLLPVLEELEGIPGSGDGTDDTGDGEFEASDTTTAGQALGAGE